jgi:hypothetical protein
MSDPDARPIEPQERRPLPGGDAPYRVTATPPPPGSEMPKVRDVGTPAFARGPMLAVVGVLVLIGVVAIVALLWWG